MKYCTCVLIGLSMLVWLSCQPKKNNGGNPGPATSSITGSGEKSGVNNVGPVMPVSEILSNFNSYWTYWNNEVFLTRDFIALDTNKTAIDRKSFLQKLTSGKYIPLRLNDENEALVYQLHKIVLSETDRDIADVTKQYAQRFYTQSKMEGKMLPAFSFKDINGNVYNREDCSGKIVVLNCWFIHCTQCVLEIPDLNRLVKEYAQHKDIVFIALAFDNGEQLRKFLSKTRFDYSIVGDMEDYLMNNLGVTLYPTQIIVDKTGRIFRYMETYDDLKYELKRLLP